MGVLLFGDDPVAVDATAARLMRLDPRQIPYLQHAGEFLGNVAREQIVQIGEQIEAFQETIASLQSIS